MGKRSEKRRRVICEEKEAEDWCFVCKDGGDLLICDHKNCGKVYHSECIEEADSSSRRGKSWICGLHYCFNCKKPPKFYCIGCPDATCYKCFGPSWFATVKGEKALCIECLELVQIIEKNLNEDSQGNKVDLNDRNTYEALFKEYWNIIKVKEGLTADDVSAIPAKYEEVKNSMLQGRGDGCEDDIYLISSDSDISDLPEHNKPRTKRKRYNSLEFIGWGSKPLIGFLKSIGKDITEPLTQLDVSSLISEYIVRKNLQHPKYKNKFIPDGNLFPIFRKKVVPKNKIYSLIEAHLAENLDHSEEEKSVDENNNNSADKRFSGQTKCIETRLSGLIRKPLIKKGTPCTRASPYASICTKNITLVYLRQSLVQELSMKPEIFESKVIGSFVKVKKNSYESPQENSHSLVLVTGATKGSTPISGLGNDEFLLQVSFELAPIPISKLSDSDITEEECKELQQNVENGLVDKLTVVKLEEKARSLHEDITKHWIARELVNLQRRIDRANLNGWMREKEACINEKMELEKPWKQEQLLQRRPYVYPEIIMTKYDPCEDYPETGKQECLGSPQSVLVSDSESPVV